MYVAKAIGTIPGTIVDRETGKVRVGTGYALRLAEKDGCLEPEGDPVLVRNVFRLAIPEGSILHTDSRIHYDGKGYRDVEMIVACECPETLGHSPIRHAAFPFNLKT